jgi:phosphatidylinositol-3-phosphatase
LWVGMPGSRPDQPESPGRLRCTACRARLAHDQRYCVECGARRGSLPRHIAGLIAAIAEQGRSATRAAGAPVLVPPRPAATRSRWARGSTPQPRAVAVAVMGMLAFGVIAGSLVGGGSVESLAAAPVLLAVSPPSHATSAAAPAPTPAATVPNGGGGGGGGGGEGASPAAAPAATQPPARTVTLPAPASPTPGGGDSSSSGLLSLPPIKHVFLIVLSDQGFNQTFGSSSDAAYLARTLPRQGELLENYYAVAGGSLANEIALISGQGPTEQTAADCPVFTDITPGTRAAEGQVIGNGCVYPSATRTLAGQLTRAGDSWKAYVEAVAKPASTACRPARLGSDVPQVPPASGEPYVSWSNPFVYFRSLTYGTACRKREVGLGRLARDLKTASAAPSLSYIVPTPCDDGSDQPCRPNAPSGLAPAETFLRRVVPEIERSAAYKANGLIAITFDQAPQTGPLMDPSSCCDSPTYPNLPAPSSTTVTTNAIGPVTTPTATSVTSTTTSTTTTATGTTPTTSTTTPSAPTTTTTSTTPSTTTTTGTTPTTTTTGTTPTTTTTGTTPSTTTATTSTPTTTTVLTPPPTTTGPTPTTPGPTTTTGGTPPTTTTSATPTTTTPAATTPAATTPSSLGGGETNPTGGGGHVGLLLISPYVKPGSVDVIGYYNHFSLLASIEDLFKLGHLGYASDPALPVFDASVFNAHPQ